MHCHLSRQLHSAVRQRLCLDFTDAGKVSRGAHGHKKGPDPFDVFAVADDETCQEVMAWRNDLTKNNTGFGVSARSC